MGRGVGERCWGVVLGRGVGELCRGVVLGSCVGELCWGEVLDNRARTTRAETLADPILALAYTNESIIYLMKYLGHCAYCVWAG